MLYAVWAVSAGVFLFTSCSVCLSPRALTFQRHSQDLFRRPWDLPTVIAVVTVCTEVGADQIPARTGRSP